eukprot:7946397-Alexandrium_andersonii.AAC.1
MHDRDNDNDQLTLLHPQRTSRPPPPGTRGRGNPEALLCSKPPPPASGDEATLRHTCTHEGS